MAGDAPDGWKTGYVLALFIVGFCLLVVFLYWQSIAENALMPLWVWRDRNFSLVCALPALTSRFKKVTIILTYFQLMATFCLGYARFSAATFYLSLYLQEVKHLTALEITVRLLPMVVSGVLVNVVCGLILHCVGNKLLTGVGALAYAASFLILSFMKEDGCSLLGVHIPSTCACGGRCRYPIQRHKRESRPRLRRIVSFQSRG